MTPRLRSVATIEPASAAFSVGRFGSRPVECPFYKFDGIDCRSELHAKPVNRLIHRHWQFPPLVNNAAHRFFDGCYHLFDRHVAVSLRHGHVASLFQGPQHQEDTTSSVRPKSALRSVAGATALRVD